MYDTTDDHVSASCSTMQTTLEQVLVSIPAPDTSSSRSRGRPPDLSAWHLSLAVLLGLLRGLPSQLEIWRLIAFFGVGSQPPIPITDQAVYDRLEQDGVAGFQTVFAQVSSWLRKRLAPYEERTLAPFATGVVALDESVLDKVKRRVKWLRDVPRGDRRLLPGRLVGLFDVRLQQWHRVDVLLDAGANCKVHARAMLEGLAKGTLILFDRGYFSFSWLDELSMLGYFYLSRTVARSRYQIVHIIYQADGVFDALVYLGGQRSQAAHVVRLVCFRMGKQQYSYLTNVLDPARLSIADIARLYARRWDIELAFRELKEHLNVRLLWSAKLGVIYQQVWACLILAQLLHAFQVELAAQAGVDRFDVSLALLTRYVPRLLMQGEDPMAFLQTHGRAMGLIRPSTRICIQAPTIPLQQMVSPPAELLQPRKTRSTHQKSPSSYSISQS